MRRRKLWEMDSYSKAIPHKQKISREKKKKKKVFVRWSRWILICLGYRKQVSWLRECLELLNHKQASSKKLFP